MLGALLLLPLCWGGQNQSASAQTRTQTRTPPPDAPALVLVGLPNALVPAAVYDSQSQKFQAPQGAIPSERGWSESLRQQSSDLKMLLNGELRNYFRRQDFRPYPTSCAGVGLWPGSYQRPWQRPLLAFSHTFPGPRNYAGNYPTVQFNAIARQWSQAAYRRHGITHFEHLHLQAITPFTLLNGQRLYFAVSSEIAAPGSEPGCGSASLLLIVEKLGRRFVTRLERYRHDPKNCVSNHFVSSFATGPEINLMMLMGQSKTARWFDILRLNAAGKFDTRYHGGGYQRNCPQAVN